MTYKVIVADNARYMDRDAHHAHGEFASLEAAIAACKRIVDDYLASAYARGMTPASLYSSYTSFGEDPFIVSAAAGTFSAWDYARARCHEICRGGQVKG
ncbi:MAG: hypothetical protein NTV97_08715 [Alphaproteobacteria bacterium]|nr:hypothetical protein [Alphaproteobacteria bacterium]